MNLRRAEPISSPPPARSPRFRYAFVRAAGVRAAGLLFACALAVASSGCVYRMNIMQGNFLEAKAVEQVAVGMTRSQVRFLLGTPMVADAFTPDRWDYVYLFVDGKTRDPDRRHFIVWFEDEKVARVEKPDGEFVDPKLPTSPGA